LPGGEQSGVRGGSEARALELSEEVLASVVGKTKVTGEKPLIKDGSAEESGKLLLFGWIARKSEGVADAGKDKTGYAAFEWLQEGDLAVGEVEGDVLLMDFDAILCRDGVDGLRIEAEGVEDGKGITGRVRGAAREREKQEGEDEEGAKPHEGV